MSSATARSRRFRENYQPRLNAVAFGLPLISGRATHPKAPLGPTSIVRLVVLDTDLHGRSFPRNCLGCRRQPSLPGGHGKAHPSCHPYRTPLRFPAPSGQRRCSALRWPKQLREKLRTRIKNPCNPCSSVSQIRSGMHFPTTPHRIGRAFKGRTALCRGFRGTKPFAFQANSFQREGRRPDPFQPGATPQAGMVRAFGARFPFLAKGGTLRRLSVAPWNRLQPVVV